MEVFISLSHYKGRKSFSFHQIFQKQITPRTPNCPRGDEHMIMSSLNEPTDLTLLLFITTYFVLPSTSCFICRQRYLILKPYFSGTTCMHLPPSLSEERPIFTTIHIIYYFISFPILYYSLAEDLLSWNIIHTFAMKCVQLLTQNERNDLRL